MPPGDGFRSRVLALEVDDVAINLDTTSSNTGLVV